MSKLLIKNARIITMADEVIEKGYILCQDGKIIDIGNSPIDEKADTIIDAKGRICMPGFIDAHCHVGMFNDSLRFEGSDGNEATDPVTPQLRAIDGIYHDDRYFVEAREAGVTTLVTGPGSANVFGGTFVALKTYGSCVDDMILKEPVAMKAALGENPKSVYGLNKKTPSTRMATAALMRKTLTEASEYLEKKDKADLDPEKNKMPKYDMMLESLIPVIKGELLLKVHAHRADDIATAIRIKKEFNLKMSIEHCTEGYLLLDLLKENKMPVICGPIISDRSKPELRNMIDLNTKMLFDIGLDVAVMTDHPVCPIKYLPLCAIVTHKAGLSEENALRAITINAAKATGIEDRVGTLEIGKDADIIILDGSPIDFLSKVDKTIINGEVVYDRENN